MRDSDDLLFLEFAVVDNELDVNGVGVTNRNPVLNPEEPYVIGTPERIRAEAELAEVIHHLFWVL
jgi:hypothetical protein